MSGVTRLHGKNLVRVSSPGEEDRLEFEPVTVAEDEPSKAEEPVEAGGSQST